MKAIIKNGLIVTFIHEGYHAIKMKYADILIEDDRILEISESISAVETDTEYILDASGKMVLPGFVNMGSQCIASKLLNGLLPDYPRHNWQGTMNYHRVQPMLKIADELLSYEEKCDLTRWAMEEAVSCGSTTLVDLNRPGFTEAVTQCAKELGIRTWVVSLSTAGEFPTAQQDGSLICEVPKGGIFDCHTKTEGLVTHLDGLYSVETTSEEMWQEIRDKRIEEDQTDSPPLFLHGAYSQYENQVSRMRYGKSPIAVINDQGALTSKTTLFNCFYADYFDRERIRTAGAHTSFSAVAAMQDGLKLPIVTMLRQNINTALGTGLYGVSMLDEMRAAAFGGKAETGMAQQYQATDAFYAATIAGAKALDQPLGRLEPGFYADMLIVNIDRLRPFNYPLINFVYQSHPQDIETVIVGGKVIASTMNPGGKKTSVNNFENAVRAQRCAEKVWKKARESIL